MRHLAMRPAAVLLGFLPLVGLAVPAAADETVVLRNGRRETGKLQACVADRCQLSGRGIPRAEIAWIGFAQGGSPPRPAEPRVDATWLADGRSITAAILGISLGEVVTETESLERGTVTWVYFGSPDGLPESAPPQPATPSLAAPPSPNTPAPAVPATPPPPAPAQAHQAQLSLNEVGVLPTPDRPAFVELLNSGTAAVALDGAELRNDKSATCRLPKGAAVPPGGLYVVSLDSGSGGAGAHCAKGFLGEKGFLELRSSSGGDVLDWSDSPTGLLLRTRGGRIPTLTPGNSFGRPPGGAGEEWVTYSRGQVSPGAPNPPPAVDAFNALPGAIFDRREVPLTWYGVGTAQRYRVQVSKTADFATIAFETVVDTPTGRRNQMERATTEPLTEGRYFWRVQAVGTAGEAPFSATRDFEVRSAQAGSAQGAAEEEVILPVRWIEQRKDTNLLALEADSENDPKPWDRPWQEQPPYCARAAIAMAAEYYGGKVSQDRLSYAAFFDRMFPDGPEIDIYVRSGLDQALMERALKYAFGVEVKRKFLVPVENWERELSTSAHPEQYFTWPHLVDEIKAGRPVVGSSECHAFVYAGYRRTREGVEFLVLDPAMGTYFFRPGPYRELTGGPDQPAGEEIKETYFLPTQEQAHPAIEEPDIYLDSDNDGVMDFDELVRFKTKASQKDSDDDGVDDKPEIRASTFEPPHGWSLRTSNMRAGEHFPNQKTTGRNLDGDELAMELDPDSDNGGCKDGDEDINGNGRQDPGESSNFDPADDGGDEDGCGRWTGTSRTRFWIRNPDGWSEITVDANYLLREIHPHELMDPGPEHGGWKAGDRLAKLVHLSCEGTTLHATWRQRYWGQSWTCNCTGEGTTTVGPLPAGIDGFIDRKRTERDLTPILGYDIPRVGGLYSVACAHRQDRTFSVRCDCPQTGGYSTDDTQFPYPAGAGLGNPLTEVRCNHDPEVRSLSGGGNRMVGSYSVVFPECAPQGADMAWSLCRAGTPCAEQPPLPGRSIAEAE